MQNKCPYYICVEHTHIEILCKIKDFNNEKRKMKVTEQLIRDIIEHIRAEARNTCPQDLGMYFQNGVVTADTATLHLKVYRRMRDVTDKMDQTY